MKLKGSINVNEGFVGVPGTGKSTLACKRAIAMGKTLPAYIIVHDANDNIPESFPDGSSLDKHAYYSIEEATKGIKDNPKGVHSICIGDAQPVFDLVLRIREDSYQKNNKVGSTPIIFMIDEVVAARQVSPYRLEPEFANLIATRRHKNIAILWTTQSPQLCHYQLFALSTQIYCFRIKHEKALTNLHTSGIDTAIINKLPSLPDHEFLVANLS